MLEVYSELSKSQKVFTDKKNQSEQCFLFCRQNSFYLLVLKFNIVLEVSYKQWKQLYPTTV